MPVCFLPVKVARSLKPHRPGDQEGGGGAPNSHSRLVYGGRGVALRS